MKGLKQNIFLLSKGLDLPIILFISPHHQFQMRGKPKMPPELQKVDIIEGEIGFVVHQILHPLCKLGIC